LEKPDVDFFELERKYGGRAKFYRTDVTDKKKLSEAFDSVVGDFGGIDGW